MGVVYCAGKGSLNVKMRANLFLLLAAMIWGFAFVAQRVGMDHVGPFTFNAVRFALGSLSLLPLMLLLKNTSQKLQKQMILDF